MESEEDDDIDSNEDTETNIKWEDPANFNPLNLPPFRRRGRNGLLVDTTDYDIIQYFEIFWPQQIYQLIAEQTNLYAEQFFDCPVEVPPNSRYRAWKDTNAEEMQAFIALELAMGICNKPNIEAYWENYWMTATPNFHQVLPRDRFEIIRGFLHFADNSKRIPSGQDGFDPLYKIRPLLELTDPPLTTAYAPGQNICIDESIRKFRGRSIYKQYNPKKPTKWGLKEFLLCESETGYTLKHTPYVGKYTTAPTMGRLVTEQVVIDLIDGFHNSSHIVFMDNFYTSPKLFLELHNLGVGACGTVRANRRDLPEEVKRAQLRRGDDPIFMSGDKKLLACGWHDVKRVNVLTTVHNTNIIPKQARGNFIYSDVHIVFVHLLVLSVVFEHSDFLYITMFSFW